MGHHASCGRGNQCIGICGIVFDIWLSNFTKTIFNKIKLCRTRTTQTLHKLFDHKKGVPNDTPFLFIQIIS